ncbi:MAG TPA: argininosuccinate lyase [bacterium]|nr:argininosuccinate lyase [bacterium]
MKKARKTWKGRFKKELDADADAFNASVDFDKRLFKYDVAAGRAHARALYKAGVINAKETGAITAGLAKVLKSEKTIDFSLYEDVHSAVEAELVKTAGEAGKKLHTGRSRNDLVSTVTRLYLMDEIREIKGLLKNLMRAIAEKARKNAGVFMPGYTHMQHAQVVSAAQWLLAYFQMFRRDYELLEFAGLRAGVMPLGSGALAGSNYRLDRKMMVRMLGFTEASANSMDAVSDRDFILDFHYFASMASMHLSRLAEEIVIFNSSEFSFIEIDDSFATGSSIMPQKKNPDIAELVRGKTGGFYGALVAALTMMKGLPLSYNKDMQEDKPALFGSVDSIRKILMVFEKFMRNIKIRGDKTAVQLKDSFMYAVDLADYLVKKGMPFRQSHETVGKIVAWCAENRRGFDGMDIGGFRRFSGLFDEDVFLIFNPEKSADSKLTRGSTSRAEINRQLDEAARFLASMK